MSGGFVNPRLRRRRSPPLYDVERGPGGEANQTFSPESRETVAHVINSLNPGANPLIAQVLRQDRRASRGLSLRACLWLAFGLGLAGLFVATWHTLTTTSNDVGVGPALLLTVGWLFHAVMPLIIASAAATFTRRTMQAGDFELLHMASISNDTLVRAFVFTALYRMRYALALMVAFTPFLVVETFLLFITLRTIVTYYPITGGPAYWEIVTPTLTALVILIGLWGTTVLGAAVGVQTALARQYTAVAALVAPASVFMIMACPSFLCMVTAPALPARNDTLALCLSVAVLLALLAGPYIIAFSIMHTTADQWRR